MLFDRIPLEEPLEDFFFLGDCVDDQIAPYLALRHRTEFRRESLALFVRNLIRFHVTIDELRDPAWRDVEGIRLHNLIDDLLPNTGVRLPFGMRHEILSDRGRERIERLEVADL